MFNKKDYINLTLEELLIEEKKTKQKETIFRFLLVILIIAIIYGIIKKGFGGNPFNFMPIIIGILNVKISKDLKEIRSLIEKKNI